MGGAQGGEEGCRTHLYAQRFAQHTPFKNIVFSDSVLVRATAWFTMFLSSLSRHLYHELLVGGNATVIRSVLSVFLTQPSSKEFVTRRSKKLFCEPIALKDLDQTEYNLPKNTSYMVMASVAVSVIHSDKVRIAVSKKVAKTATASA
ncbi:hypothetical protein CEXT_270081 [Caerostris extrusa]|uniref:Uncharacterized protein n=1 Tax=Caerostris extrusa TaxID=172846 RepID=A0AAV4X7P6_CAEEX|nr:hypothetical protein CEXT_270081 [Caerostris extrusa]